MKHTFIDSENFSVTATPLGPLDLMLKPSLFMDKVAGSHIS